MKLYWNGYVHIVTTLYLKSKHQVGQRDKVFGHTSVVCNRITALLYKEYAYAYIKALIWRVQTLIKVHYATWGHMSHPT